MEHENSNNMESQKSKQQRFLSRGSKVEVTTNEEGFKGSWYTATIINPSLKSKPKPTKNLFWIEYEGLVTEDDPKKPLIECVHVSNLRPLPPRDLTDHRGGLEVNDVVEASYRDGWWTGVVVRVIDDDDDDGRGGGGLRFSVAFECPYEEIVFRLHELRLHVDWVDGKWVRPQKKKIVVAITDGSETELSTQLKSAFTKVSTSERIPPSTKKLKKERSHSEGTKPQKKLKKEHAFQDSPVLTSCQNNSLSTKISSEKADCISVSTDKGDRNVDCELKSLERHKHSTESLSPMKNLDRNEENAEKSNHKTEMGRQRKELLQRFLNSLQGDEANGDGEHVHEKAVVSREASEAEMLEAMGNFSAGTQRSSSGGAFVVSEMDYGTHDVESAIDKRGVFISKALALCPESRDQQENVTSSPAVIAGSHITSEKNQCWPFIKRSGIWKVVDSMDIFTRMPQMPHFSPLNEYEENSREKLAICLMMKFAYEVDKISRLSPDDLKNTSFINDRLDSLKELEPHGFDITEVKVQLNDLLRESELQGKREEVESKIRKCESEKAAADNEIRELVKQMKSLEEKLKSAKSEKCLKEQELAKLESAKSIVSEEIQSLQLDFRRKVSLLW